MGDPARQVQQHRTYDNDVMSALRCKAEVKNEIIGGYC